MAEWKLIRKPLYWEDGSHTLPRHYVLIDKKHQCSKCKGWFEDNEQGYVYHDKITMVKKASRHIARTQHLCIYNHVLLCGACFLSIENIIGVWHKVVLQVHKA